MQSQLRNFKLHTYASNYAIIVACLAYIGIKYNLPVTTGENAMAKQPKFKFDMSMEAARQDEIEVGDFVRSFDFPGTSMNEFIEGVVTAKDIDGHFVTVHVTRDVFVGRDDQVGHRLLVDAPLGVSSRNLPGVFLIAKAKVRS